MTQETLAIEQQEELPSPQAANPAPQQTAEITTLTFDSFKLVGGGSGIVVF
jgi:hypothetical protein